MIVDIYKSKIKGRKFIAFESGKEIPVSWGDDSDYENIELFKSNVDLVKGIISITPEAAENDINQTGYHKFGAGVNLTESPE